MVRIAIIDYGVGNLHSIRRGIEIAGATAEVTRDVEKIREASAIVLPGVGAFKSAVEQLNKDLILESVAEGKPLLGVCLGLQLFMEWSVEGGGCEGLKLIEGDVAMLPKSEKVPQMGWNTIEIVKEHPFLNGIKPGSHVYFVHSFYIRPKNPKIVIATTQYGVKFPSVISNGVLIGTQFHPEKSGEVGLRMLKNFVQIVKK